MALTSELFRFHAWATLRLIDHCAALPPERLLELVPGTDRSILHTLTHLIGSDQRYVDSLIGEVTADPIRRGEVLAISDLRQRFEAQFRRWDVLLERIDLVDVTLPADEQWPEVRHAQNLLLLQAIQHGIDHRTQICTALSLLGIDAPGLDGWSYWEDTYLIGS